MDSRIRRETHEGSKSFQECAIPMGGRSLEGFSTFSNGSLIFIRLEARRPDGVAYDNYAAWIPYVIERLKEAQDYLESILRDAGTA